MKLDTAFKCIPAFGLHHAVCVRPHEVTEASAHRLIAVTFDSPDALQNLHQEQPEILEERTGLGDR